MIRLVNMILMMQLPNGLHTNNAENYNNTDSITIVCRRKAVEDVTCFILCYPNPFYSVRRSLEIEEFPFPLPMSSQSHISPPGSPTPANGKANSYLPNIYISQSLSQRRQGEPY